VIDLPLTSVRRPSKVTLIALCVLILTGTLLGYGSLTKSHIWGDDFASYIMQAQSIIELNPQSFVHANKEAVKHSEQSGFPIAYPWGAPALLAPAHAIFGMNIQALKIPNLICFALSLVSLFALFRPYHSALSLLFLLSFFSVSPLILQHLNLIGSDIPFFCASSFAMFLIDSIIVKDKRLLSRTADLAILGSCIALTVTIRGNGWLLLLPLAVAQVCKLRSSPRACPPIQRAQLFLPYLWCGAVLWAWNLIFPPSHYRFSAFPPMTVELFVRNLATYYLLPRQFFDGAPCPWIFYILFLVFGVVGVSASWRRAPHFVVYTGATLGLYMLWPYYQGVRFVLPILPFLFHFVLDGIRATGGQLPIAKQRLFSSLVGACGALIIVSLGITSVSVVAKNLRGDSGTLGGPYSPHAEEMFSFISTHTNSDDEIIFFKPRLMRMRTGRPSFQADQVESLEYADYLCIYKVATAAKENWLFAENIVDDLARQGRLLPVFENKEFVVGRILSEREKASP
jgi:hypothetical protein